MIEPLRLAYTPDMSVAGVAASLQVIHRIHLQPSTAYLTRNIAANKASELAFRRYLQLIQMPFENRESLLPGLGPAELLLGGRPVQIFACLVSRRTAIRQLLRQPGSLSRSTAIIPLDVPPSEKSTIYLFAFVLGLVTHRQTDQVKLDEAGLPAAWVWVLPEKWRLRTNNAALGEITLKSTANHPLHIEMVGIEPSGSLIQEHIELSPHQRYLSREVYQSASYLRCNTAPHSQIGLYSSVLNETLISSIRDWINLWIYGMQIIFTGYITAGNFCEHARRVPAGSNIFPYQTLHAPGLALSLSHLNSIQDLFTRVKDWETANYD